MSTQLIKDSLKKADDWGVQNLVCLRGDPPGGVDQWRATEGGFSRAADLIRFVRQEYGNYFGIAVAGYPEGHPDGEYTKDLQFLKEKIDAGGEIIITQLFYDVDQFLKFVTDVRSMGITAPILPGIMPIQNYAGFKRMVSLCKTNAAGDLTMHWAHPAQRRGRQGIRCSACRAAVPQDDGGGYQGLPFLHAQPREERDGDRAAVGPGHTHSAHARAALDRRALCFAAAYLSVLT